jgi:hypothetical protein
VKLNCDLQLRKGGKLPQFDLQLSSAMETEMKSNYLYKDINLRAIL